jgi:predicted glutamine amidotransferase
MLPQSQGQVNRSLAGDGFGIGYYTDPKLGPEPCIFTSTTPAWNCVNLQRIASKTASHLIFAHVRATTEGSLSDDNCHPFCHGSLMWMHNGGLGGWKHIKRRLGERLADKWYLGVHGGTDSEWAFALFLDTLERMDYNPSSPPPNGFGPNVLRQAMLKTIKQINDFIGDIPPRVVQEENVDTRSLLNFAIADGHSVVCTRYVSSRTDEAASLYYSSGTTWEDKSKKGEYQMDRRDKGADIILVASEPLTFERGKYSISSLYACLTFCRKLGNSPDEFNLDNSQTNRHGTPNNRRILQLQPLPLSLLQVRSRQRPHHERKRHSGHQHSSRKPWILREPTQEIFPSTQSPR